MREVAYEFTSPQDPQLAPATVIYDVPVVSTKSKFWAAELVA